ncbi:MAG: glycosyltransferase family 87 protein [Myxococcota bacterium]|nr:glycosyltransferase family 87 protein [Myxococcota bacterium]MEC8422724.1 glycosyltransferase family 87 protein [Myxococcota bacterium]
MVKRAPLRTAAIAFLLALYAVQAGFAFRSVRRAPSGRDFATYHYAVQEAWAGGDPYDTPALGRRARADGTRRAVHPYFYPPPFLLGMLWAVPLSLSTAYQLWFGIQQLCVFGILAAMRRWFGASWLLLALILATFTPVPDNLKMGQANLPVLLLTVVGLWRAAGPAGGVLVGMAGMAKMSPAINLLGWMGTGRWRPALLSVLTAVGLSVAALPLVGLDTQLRFYTEILPGFSTGEYHGLRVPITLPANHSIPDLFNQLWPGPDKHHLDPRAAGASKLVSAGLIAGMVPIFRRSRGKLGEACAFGALAVLSTVTPVYAYEHHLVFLLLPAAALGAAVGRGLLPRGAGWIAGAAGFFTAWPLYVLRPAQNAMPAFAWMLQESKFAGAMTLGLLCAWAAWRSGDRSPSAGAAD